MTPDQTSDCYNSFYAGWCLTPVLWTHKLNMCPFFGMVILFTRTIRYIAGKEIAAAKTLSSFFRPKWLMFVIAAMILLLSRNMSNIFWWKQDGKKPYYGPSATLLGRGLWILNHLWRWFIWPLTWRGKVESGTLTLFPYFARVTYWPYGIADSKGSRHRSRLDSTLESAPMAKAAPMLEYQYRSNWLLSFG